MGLGGIARDSIVGLDKLVHDDDDDDEQHPPPRGGHTRRHSGGGGLSGSWNKGSNKDGGGGDEFLFLDDDNDDAAAATAAPSGESIGTFETSLNDGLEETASPTPSRTSFVASSSPSPAAADAAATSYSKVSSTNTRSLDSYRPLDGSGPDESAANKGGSGGAKALHYQGFQYEGYTDYYSEGYDYEDYGHLGYSNSASKDRGGNGNGNGNNNIFCCLFAPWLQQQQQTKAIERGEDQPDQVAGPEQTEKQDEAAAASDDAQRLSASGSSSASVNDVAPAPVVAPPTPSPKGAIPATAQSLRSEFMPSPPPGADVIEPAELPTSTSEAVTAEATAPPPVDLAPSAKRAEPPAALPREDLVDNGGCFDEKKQEDADLHPHLLAQTDESEVREEREEEKEKEKEGPPPIRGILKVRRCSTGNGSNSSQDAKKKNTKKNKSSSSSSSSPASKRHLFPVYEPKTTAEEAGSGGGDKKSKKNKLAFIPMARVLTIPSRKDIPFQQRAQVWWQKSDYDEFKKTGRIISKAMECGGSEIWLASSNAWGNKSLGGGKKSKAIKVDYGKGEGDGGAGESEDEYNKALSKYVPEDKKADNSDEEGDGGGENKWWCKFGHSRRGIEHVASSAEGRARQRSVVLAQRMVMEEQRRQRMSRTKDPNKLRNVALQYTSWARDLALAAGSADAEAVESGFSPGASTRAHHFARRLNVCSNSLHLLNQSDAGGGVAMAVTSQLLDANTHAKPSRGVGGSKDMAGASHGNSEASLSKRAKGFMPGGGGEEFRFRSVNV